ncbi:hypothetical protein PBAL39_15984 [Pedobacter sp. BAL39]|nr:hypothetical protein PBAL39_15984 [Pedobacter sp. BAL39]
MQYPKLMPVKKAFNLRLNYIFFDNMFIIEQP